MFPFETWEQGTFFSENVAVNLYLVSVVARALSKVWLLGFLFRLIVVRIYIE